MGRIISFVLAMVLLVITCSSCWWHEREEHEGDRGGYGEHDHGGYGEHERH
jgi:hypothetical protein